jgi:hypothetical protein
MSFVHVTNRTLAIAGWIVDPGPGPMHHCSCKGKTYLAADHLENNPMYFVLKFARNLAAAQQHCHCHSPSRAG